MASKLQKLFGNIAQFALPAAGFALGGPVGAGIGGAIGGAVSGTGALKRAAIGGATGYGGGQLAKGFGVPSFGGSGGGGGIGGYLSNLFGGGNAYAASAPMTSQGLAGASSYSNPFGAFAGASQNPAMGATSLLSSSPSSLNKSGGGFNLKDLFGKNKNLMTGLGIAGASQLFGSPRVPELPDSVKQFQEMTRNGGSALNQQAQGALSTELSRPFEQVSAEEEQAALRQLEKDQVTAEDQVRDLYRNLRPGTDPSTDSAFRRDLADVQDRFAKTKTDTVTQLRRQVSNDFQGNRIRQILAAQGVDQTQMQNLLAANQYDVDRTLAQLQIDDRDKKFLREYLLQFGGNVVANSLGTEQPSSGFDQFLELIRGK